MSAEKPDGRVHLAAMGGEIEAARETIEVLIQRYEGSQGPLQTDQFAVQKAMAALENTVAVNTRALRASEARLRTLFDHGPHMLITVDRHGAIVSANRLAARALRRPPRDMVGLPLVEVLDDESRDAVLDMVRRRFEGVVERTVVLVNGVQVAMTAAPLPGLAGETQLVLRDLTWRRLLEEELQHSRRLAMFGHLASIVGHEINNPLAVMLGRLEMLLQSDLDDPERLRTHLHRVLEHGQRIGRIVQDLQAVVRPRPARLERVALTGLLDEVCELAGPFLGRAVVWVDVTPPSLEVYADREQLRQALINLVGNAADRMRRTGRVVVRAEPAGDGGPWSERVGVTVSVFDKGASIPKDMMDNLLAPRQEQGSLRVGYSLGLAIAQSVALEHGGALRAENDPEGGAVFSLLLPSGGGQASERGDATPVEGPELRLLCVDDDPLIRPTLERMFRGTRCSVVVVRTGEEALDRLADHEFDALLTSIRLPGMSGVELRHAVARRDPVLGGRTVLLGGSLRGAPVGVRTLPRPFSRLQLLSTLEDVLPSELLKRSPLDGAT